MSGDQLQLRGWISTLPKPDQDEIHARAEELRAVIRSSRYGIMACALVGLEIQDDMAVTGTLLQSEDAQ